MTKRNRSTHTYTILHVPHAVYTAVRTLLVAADYEHAFVAEEDGEIIDLHGLALQSRGGPTGSDITISTLLSQKTKEPRIDFTLDGQLTQMDLDKAREIVDMLQDAIEASVSDALIYRFLTQKVGMSAEHASYALIDFRELRQGTRGLAYNKGN